MGIRADISTQFTRLEGLRDTHPELYAVLVKVKNATESKRLATMSRSFYTCNQQVLDQGFVISQSIVSTYLGSKCRGEEIAAIPFAPATRGLVQLVSRYCLFRLNEAEPENNNCRFTAKSVANIKPSRIETIYGEVITKMMRYKTDMAQGPTTYDPKIHISIKDMLVAIAEGGDVSNLANDTRMSHLVCATDSFYKRLDRIAVDQVVLLPIITTYLFNNSGPNFI